MLVTRGNIDKISGEVTDGLGGFHPLKGKVPPPPPLLYSTRRSPLCWFNKGRQYQVRLQALTDADGIANSTSKTRCIRRSSPISKVRVLANQNKPKHTPGICEKSGRDDATRMVRFASAAVLLVRSRGLAHAAQIAVSLGQTCREINAPRVMPFAENGLDQTVLGAARTENPT